MRKVVVYTARADPYSVRLKEFLRRKNILFEEIICDNSPDVPRLVVDGVVIGDYEQVTSLDLKGEFDAIFE